MCKVYVVTRLTVEKGGEETRHASSQVFSKRELARKYLADLEKQFGLNNMFAQTNNEYVVGTYHRDGREFWTKAQLSLEIVDQYMPIF